MSKHPTDHDHSPEENTARTREYTKKERAGRPSEASKAAQKEPRERSDAARLKAFTKIEREKD